MPAVLLGPSYMRLQAQCSRQSTSTQLRAYSALVNWMALELLMHRFSRRPYVEQLETATTRAFDI
jgi:hypothetical protein